jgi:hypothetical protein
MLANAREKKAFNLTDEEIEERLRIDNGGLIDEIHKTVSGMLYEENERQKQIDTKRASSIAVVGLSTSLVFSLGGLLIEKITNVSLPIIGCPIPWLVLFYFTTSITLLLSMLLAYQAIKARSDWVWFSEQDIFNQEVLKEDQTDYYKRYMITHMWKLYRNNFGINQMKGESLKCSQLFFILGLIQLMPIIAIISLYTLNKGGVF